MDMDPRGSNDERGALRAPDPVTARRWAVRSPIIPYVAGVGYPEF